MPTDGLPEVFTALTAVCGAVLLIKLVIDLMLGGR